MSTTDNEREALIDIILDAGEYVPGSHADDYLSPTKAADAILAAGFHRQGPVTDEQADAASLAFHEFVFGPKMPMSERARGIQRQAWKVALEAARNA